MFPSVQFSHSLLSYSLQPHGLQYGRPPCPSPPPRVYSNSCPFSWWCHPTISSSVIAFSHNQSFPASRSLQMIKFFASCGQSIGVSDSTSVLPINTNDWSPLRWTGWIFCSPRDSPEFSHHSLKASVLWHSAFFIVPLSHPYMTTRKTIALTRWTFVGIYC